MAHLLVVDDDVDVCWMLQELLEREGHVVRVANDGEAGLRLLDESRPDAIVLDVEMPRLDGPTMAYRMFVHNAGLENIPIVLLSGVHDLHATAQRVGTPYYLGKPFDFEALMSIVGRAVVERGLARPSA